MIDDSQNWLANCLEKLPSTRVGVFGDFCLDSYWLIDPDQSELSVETHLPVRRVRQQHYSLGGAANIVANLVDLGVGQVHAVGLVGDDLFGRVVLDMLGRIGVSTENMLSCQGDWQTMVFAKPYLGDEEQNRIDFGGFNAISGASVEALAKELDGLAERVDVIILNQQVPVGVSTAAMIEQVNKVIGDHPKCKFIVDSRDRTELYQGVMIKLNAHEASRLADKAIALDERISAGQAREYGVKLFERFGQPVFLTRGENGIVVVDEQGLQEVPGIQVVEQIDSVGAGDAAMAALGAVIGSGGNCLMAAKVANIAATVTVRKIKTTGTASPAEILQVGPNPDYVYLPELADDPRGAK